jgi:hypothetical protein
MGDSTVFSYCFIRYMFLAKCGKQVAVVMVGIRTVVREMGGYVDLIRLIVVHC